MVRRQPAEEPPEAGRVREELSFGLRTRAPRNGLELLWYRGTLVRIEYVRLRLIVR